MKLATTLSAILLAVLARPGSADEVILLNGSVFTGVVRENGEKVVLEMDCGTMTFKKVDVRSVSRGDDPIREFEKRSAAASDVKGMLDLASWARDKGLAARTKELYRKVLRLDPDQAEARKALGFEKVNGLWLEGDELMAAKGVVKVNGRWLTKDAARVIQAQEAQARAEGERLAAAARVADQEHEREMARIALERERLALLGRSDWDFPRCLTPWAGGAAVPQSVVPVPPTTFGPVPPPSWTGPPSPASVPVGPAVRRR